MSEELDKSNNIVFSIDADDSFLIEKDIVDELPLEAVDKKIEEFIVEEKPMPFSPKIEKTVKKEIKKEPVKKDKKEKTVAIHSTRNVTWNGVGKVYRGYNIVDEETAAKWLTRDHTRIATPQEVAKEYGL